MEKLKQTLKEMGLTDEQINKFVSEAISDKFVPKHRFDEVYEKNKQLTDTLSERDSQIENLKKFEGDSAKLRTKIEELEQLNKQKDEDNAKAITALKTDNAINNALDGKVQKGYVDLVLGLIDKSSIILKDDGSVSGLIEQVDKLKKDKPLLFVAENNQPADKPDGWSFKGDNPNDAQKHTGKSLSENFVTSLLADSKTVSEVTSKATKHYFGDEQ